MLKAGRSRPDILAKSKAVSTSRKILEISVVLALFCANIFLSFQQKDSLEEERAELLVEMRQVVDRLNAETPEVVDEVTTLTRVELNNMTYVYYMTLDVAYEDSEKEKEIIDKVYYRQICKNPYMSDMKKSGVGIRYIFSFVNDAPDYVLDVNFDKCE